MCAPVHRRNEDEMKITTPTIKFGMVGNWEYVADCRSAVV